MNLQQQILIAWASAKLARAITELPQYADPLYDPFGPELTEEEADRISAEHYTEGEAVELDGPAFGSVGWTW